MKAKMNAKEVDVLTLAPHEAYGVAAGLLEGVGVDEGEFPERGIVYLLQTSDYTPEELQEGYESIVAMEKERGHGGVPSIAALEAKNGICMFQAEYEIQQPAEGEWAMVFLSVEALNSEYELDESGNLVETRVESLEEMRKHWRDFIIPIPPPPKSGSDEVFLTLAYEFYDAIKVGAKTTEYRSYSANWVKKLLSRPVRTVKFQRGYGGPGHAAPEQMVWKVDKIWLYESGSGTKGDPMNPPEGIIPDCIAIDLGTRVM